MFKHPFVNGIKRLLQALLKPLQCLANRLVADVLRLLFNFGQYSDRTQRGFVLPTTVLLLLVVSLAVGSISLRSYQRTQQVILGREQQVIYNIATPALDRARAKFEYLFRGDPRFPSGIPSEGVMNSLLLDGSNLLPGVADAYVLDDETPLDLDADVTPDAAWSYRADTDDDGILDATVAYSIILQTPRESDSYPMRDSSDAALAGRADALQVRNAPLSGSRQLISACQLNDAAVPLEQGWFKDEASSAVLRKNLQVDVYVQPDDPARTLATLEFQQDRQLDQGNKWGAWFRSDIDISPGPPFNWNGAMHTEGNLMVARTGRNSKNRKFTGYLVSSPNSCIYTSDASEITVANTDADPDKGIPEFRGQVIGQKGFSGDFKDNDESVFHLHDTPAITSGDAEVLLNKDRDSVKNSDDYGPADFSLDPLLLATEGVSQSRDTTIDFNSVYDQMAWENNPIHQKNRIYAESEEPPYLDDFFRADDRFGPNPRYGDVTIPANTTIGDEITGDLLKPDGLSDETLTREDAPSDDADGVGLDGYWERRARQNGLRLIVGQRLELGNAFGWGGLDQNADRRTINKESLKPWDGCEGDNNDGRCNEARHRLTLRDNLAAVQATAIYHHSSSTTSNDDTPSACWASTVHPGTPQTLIDSATFRDLSTGLESFWPSGNWFNDQPLLSNFFLGQGSNGWEYEVPSKTTINDSTDPMIRALQNLAYYAGDPNGGAPSFKPVQDDVVHPFPYMAMWGDFSVLRRIFDERWPSGGYSALSIADKATLRSVACAVGMLAYNIGYLDSMDDTSGSALLNNLEGALSSVVASSPEQAIADPSLTDQQKQLATLIMLREQLDRDRLYGFQAGPGFQSNDCNVWTTTPLEKLCTDYPKYPILYSLFPLPGTGIHDEVAGSSREGPTLSNYIQTANPNSSIQYQVIDLRDDSVLDVIALKPKALNQWTLPHGNPSNATTNPNSNEALTIACVAEVCGAGTNTRVVDVPFKDTALMNSREKMAVRVLNMDVDLLRTSSDNLSNDVWLPNSGLIYAFREDAVREDEIVRPESDPWPSCNVNDKYEVNSPCRMAIDVHAYGSTDPPLNPDNLISPKAVDYYADPDRRPHGFRLINGSKINRGANPRGLSLISDNPVYIQGDFNLHQTTSCNGSDSCRLEEFTQQLDDTTFNNFYTRNNLNTDFARPNQDLWRPAEILTDAVTILSANFCDGSYIDGWLTAGEGVGTTLTNAAGEEGIDVVTDYGCTGGSGSGDRTSFLNFMRPETPIGVSDWHHENPFDDHSPVALSRHGDPLFVDSATNTLTAYGDGVNDYFKAVADFGTEPNDLAAAIVAEDTRVNAVMISGVVPMRKNQGYGGLHNFPRFISQWASSDFGTQRALNIAGAFFQLNYSNYATGPFDQDAFETNQEPIPGSAIPYYYPPKRLWGYDVGLQYAQAGPIAQRFVAASALRSEFYSEPPADDPYMVNLCRAMVNANPAGNDPDTSCASVLSSDSG